MAVRSFIALPVPEPISAVLGDCAARLASQDKERRVRWVDEHNFHITLAFLGDIDEQVLDDLALDLDDILFDRGPISIHVESVAQFPFGKRPRLIAGMIEASDELQKIWQAVAQAVRRRAIPLEKRRFYPHITLGRLRTNGKLRMQLPPMQTNLQGEVGHLCIYQSTLTPHGAIYEVLYQVELDTVVGADFSDTVAEL